VATLKIRLANRQKQHSITPLNLEELKKEKAVQFAAEMTNRFTTFVNRSRLTLSEEAFADAIDCYTHTLSDFVLAEAANVRGVLLCIQGGVKPSLVLSLVVCLTAKLEYQLQLII